jgi:hypothetical protein
VYEEKIPLHKIKTVPIAAHAGNEWELVCYECTFRARFTRDINHGANRLEILDVGDPLVRHTGTHGSATELCGIEHETIRRRRAAEAAWLTPELREKLSDILQALD